MMNSVNIIGRLTKAPELKKTTTDKTVCSGTIAQNKHNKEETLFVMFEAWGKSAEYIANYGDKGRLIGISGRLDCRKWEKDGQQQERWFIVVDEASYLDKVTQDSQATKRDEYDPFADE